MVPARRTRAWQQHTLGPALDQPGRSIPDLSTGRCVARPSPEAMSVHRTSRRDGCGFRNVDLRSELHEVELHTLCQYRTSRSGRVGGYLDSDTPSAYEQRCDGLRLGTIR
eukprot:2685361-Rhodomonas_salina.5